MKKYKNLMAEGSTCNDRRSLPNTAEGRGDAVSLPLPPPPLSGAKPGPWWESWGGTSVSLENSDAYGIGKMPKMTGFCIIIS